MAPLEPAEARARRALRERLERRDQLVSRVVLVQLELAARRVRLGQAAQLALRDRLERRGLRVHLEPLELAVRVVLRDPQVRLAQRVRAVHLEPLVRAVPLAQVARLAAMEVQAQREQQEPPAGEEGLVQQAPLVEPARLVRPELWGRAARLELLVSLEHLEELVSREPQGLRVPLEPLAALELRVRRVPLEQPAHGVQELVAPAVNPARLELRVAWDTREHREELEVRAWREQRAPLEQVRVEAQELWAALE